METVSAERHSKTERYNDRIVQGYKGFGVCKFKLVELGYPYSVGYYHDDLGFSIVNHLIDILPHGSGIDYTWVITQQLTKHNRISCQNAYHSMDENGMYDRIYDFTLVVDYAMGFEFIRLNFNGTNPEKYKSRYWLRDYLESEFYYFLTKNDD